MEQDRQQSKAPASPKRRGRRALAVILAVLIVAAAFLAGWLGSAYSRDARLRKLEWMIGTLDEEYYKDVDLDALYDALYGVVVPDRFSYFYTADEYAQLIAESEGRNEGVGVTLLTESDGVRFYAVVENSPACLAGIEKGMYLLGWSEVGGAVQTGSASELISFIDTQAGEFILYAGFAAGETPSESNAYTVDATEYRAAYCLYRDSESAYAFRGDEQIVLTDVTEEKGALAGLDADTAYIRLDSFDGNCAEEFAACLSLMKSRGRSNLVLDLRGNGGGYMSDLQAISAHLLKNAEANSPVVARAVFRDGSETLYRADGNDYSAYFTDESRVTVLADENTASASECLIGALIDYGTIGYEDIYLRHDAETGVCRTYGKGVMQSTFTTIGGDAFRLTVAEIFWPNGNSIHEKGVTPSYPQAGAHAVTAPMLPDGTDAFLAQVLAALA